MATTPGDEMAGGSLVPTTQDQNRELIAQPTLRRAREPRPGLVAPVTGRATQPMGAMDMLNARVPGFEDVIDQPDWGGNGFSGRKSDVRVVRFDRG